MEYCQPGTLTQALVSRVFIGACSHRRTADLSLQPLQKMRCYCETAAPTISHSVSIDYTMWSKTPGKQRHTHQAGHPKGVGATQGQTSLWARWILTAQSPPTREGGDSPRHPFPPSVAGKIEFTWQEAMIGLESSLLMFPINLLIVQIFRNTRPRRTKKQSTGRWAGGLLGPAPSLQPMEDGLPTLEAVTKAGSQPQQCRGCSGLGRSGGGEWGLGPATHVV